MTVEIRNFKPCSKGSLKGEFEVYLPKIGLLFKRFKVFENPKGRWLGFPSFMDEDKNWHPFFEFTDKNIDDKFKESILRGLDAHLEPYHDAEDLSPVFNQPCAK